MYLFQFSSVFRILIPSLRIFTYYYKGYKVHLLYKSNTKIRKYENTKMSTDKDSESVTPSSAPVPSPAVVDTMVKVIMGQTEMSHDEVVSALERTNYDLKRVIREYMCSGTAIPAVKESPLTSTNQLRFSEIRQFMDTSDQMYYRRQEMTKIYNQVLERKKAEAEAVAAATAATAATASKL